MKTNNKKRRLGWRHYKLVPALRPVALALLIALGWLFSMALVASLDACAPQQVQR